MFKKSFKVKSNTQIKASERKNFKQNLLKSFPTLSDSAVDAILSKKDVINNVKIATASGEVVQVYTVQRRPIIFDVGGTWYPTVYLLWQCPDLVPIFTTHSQVLSFITSGADLMLPGVLTPQTPNKYGNLPQNALAAVNLSHNRAPIAVGVTAQTSQEMTSGRGKCVTILHFWGDKLCTLEGLNCLPVPDLGPPGWLKLKGYDHDFPELGSSKTEKIDEMCENCEGSEATEIVEELLITEEKQEEEVKEMTTEEMDELLNYCFFVAIKYSKTLTLPILTSNFFKMQLLPQCPDGKVLDIKKTSYKKLKPFLDSMHTSGIITIREVKKGVESIVAINKDDPKYSAFYVDHELRPKKDEKQEQSTNITESFIVTQNVLPLFADSGFSKGDVVQKAEIRRLVTEYVKTRDCQVGENKRLLKPHGVLVGICKTQNPIAWEELMEKVCDSMKSCFKVQSGVEEIFNKGKVPPITMTVSVRSGNKKVTLVDNLEAFGVNINQFAKECQHGIAASTSISKPVGKKYDQLLVQGNQVLFIYNLLTEKYKIPQRYIRGLENAPKKKK